MVIEGGISGRPLQNYLHKTLFTYCLQPLMLALLPSPESTLAQFSIPALNNSHPIGQFSPLHCHSKNKTCCHQSTFGGVFSNKNLSPIDSLISRTYYILLIYFSFLSIQTAILQSVQPNNSSLLDLVHHLSEFAGKLDGDCMAHREEHRSGSHRSGFNSWCHHLLKVCLE